MMGVVLTIIACFQHAAACSELQIGRYETVTACVSSASDATSDWLRKMKMAGIEPKLVGYRCGPSSDSIAGRDA